VATATQDAVLAGAVDLAREAALELAEHAGDVGEHLGSTVDSDRLVSHRFACTARGYRGWVWTVTLSRVPRARKATVCEAVLLPGDDAVLAPAWLPWDERLRPGDVGPGDVLPFRADDPRLEPGFVPTGDPDVDEVAIGELALARNRVLSQTGIAAAAERWYRGRQGPTSAGSVASAESCLTCGFLVPLQGSLGTLFGVCVNEWSPDDGKVVALDHGCGAHSETDVEARPSEWPEVPVARDLVVEPTADLVAAGAGVPVAEPEPDAAAPAATDPEEQPDALVVDAGEVVVPDAGGARDAEPDALAAEVTESAESAPDAEPETPPAPQPEP